MKFLLLVALLWVSTPPMSAPGAGFTVEACENVSSQFPGAPRLQSFAFAQWDRNWVFIGGRAAGYHSVGGGSAEFLAKDANQEVWVVDTTLLPAKTYHVPVANLPAGFSPVRYQWSSTGLLYTQDGAKLYIAGGYGKDREGNWVTFPLLTEVDLPRLIDGVKKGQIPTASIAFVSSPLVQSAGGELIKLPDNYFYLVMGHVFMGSYTAFEGQGEQNRTAASQHYLNEIRKLAFDVRPKAGLNVRLVDCFRDEIEFHRRDLNVAELISPEGEGLAVYGGVFTPGSQLNFTKPIYLLTNRTPQVDEKVEQKMNSYNCPHLVMYDKSSLTLHTTFFGGISRYSWDATTNAFLPNALVGSKTTATYLDGMQWSDQISTLSRTMAPGNENTHERVEAQHLPAFLGSGAVFIPEPSVVRVHPGSGILDFQALQRGKTFVGYIYGGIRAFPYQFPYDKSATPYNSGAVPSNPSEMVLKVYVTKQ